METIEDTASAAAPEPRTVEATPETECMIHVRFYPDGTVADIGERPASTTPHDWFKFLSRHTQNCYQAFSGGRGLFRLPRSEVNNLKAACAAEHAK